MPEAGFAGRDASVGPARLARAPTRSSQTPAVVRLAACVMGREGEHGEGPASYRGLSLRHAMAGLPKQFRAGLRATSLRFQRAIMRLCPGLLS